MWRTRRRGTHPNCTAVQMETGWCHWAAVSVALATRRWMAIAGVRCCFGCLCVGVFVLFLEQYSERKTNRKRNRDKRGEGVASH